MLSGDAMPPTRVSKLTQTCKGNLSQWEGLTDDGQFIYVRYRWGCLSIGSGKTMDEAVENANNLFGEITGSQARRQLGIRQVAGSHEGCGGLA
jgi:hypothetical protein